MTDFQLHQQIHHSEYGECTVAFVDTDVVGIRTADGNNVLIRRTAWDTLLAARTWPRSPAD